MADIRSLQDMLNSQADARLIADLKSVLDALEKFRCVGGLHVQVTIKNTPTYISGSDGLIMSLQSQLFALHKEAYREAESLAFMAQVDSFRLSLDALSASTSEAAQ